MLLKINIIIISVFCFFSCNTKQDVSENEYSTSKLKKTTRNDLAVTYSQFYHRLPLYENDNVIKRIRYCINNSIGDGSACINFVSSDEYDIGYYFFTAYLEGKALYNHIDKSLYFSDEFLNTIFENTAILLSDTKEDNIEDFLSQRGNAYIVSLEVVIGEDYKKTIYCHAKKMDDLCPLLNKFKTICPNFIAKLEYIHTGAIHEMCKYTPFGQ